MALTLYCSLTSPYARRVRLATRLLALSAEIREEIVNPFDSPAALLARNPLSKIPVLSDEAGLLLPDSHLILSYLLQRTGLSMPAARGDWEQARQLVLAEGLTDASIAIVMENRRPESIRYPQQIDRQAAAITRCLDAVATPPDQAFERVDPIALSLASALAYLDFRLPWLQWRQQQPRLATWLDCLEEHAAMRETRPPESA
jgi:glutathione S-transferase